MTKFKREAVRGIQSHNQRERKSHSNPDVEENRSGLNYDLVNAGRVSFQKIIDRRLDELDLKKSPRHDAVFMCGHIVSSAPEFFKNLNPEETRRFFEEAKKFLSDFVGPENVISAVVHLDEKTPHLHFMHVPVTPDGRLNANAIYTRSSLRKLQDDLPKYLQGKGFRIGRGVRQEPDSAKKHLDSREYKQQMEAVKNLQGQAAEESENLRAARQSILQEEMTWRERVRVYEKISAEAEAVLAEKSELPPPGLFNAKAIHEEAMSIISSMRKALADKSLVEARNERLEREQALVDEKIAAIEKGAAKKIATADAAVREAEGQLQAWRRDRKRLDELNTKIFAAFNRALGQPEEQPTLKTYELILTREREERERREKAEKEARHIALNREARERWAAKKAPTADPPEPEKTKSFACGR
jgi:hypothetical protein